MSPVVKRRRTGRAPATSTRRPLSTANNATQCNPTEILANLVEIFNNSQHVTSSDQALTQLKKLYNSADFAEFEKPFMDCLRKLLQSKQTIYFKTSCDFICKFLQHVTNAEDDRLVRSCADVADHYMQISNEDSRQNATFFVSKFLSHIESLDEQICNALKVTLPKRIRDKKPAIRAQAVLASRKFQDNKLIQEGFKHHFSRDPELIVRKALLQTMDISIFGLDFLAEATQDSHENIRKTAFQRLSKVSPSDLSKEQLHQIMHNGLFERERQAAFSFKTNTLDPWLVKMYDGIDLVKLLEPFDVVKHPEEVERLLTLIHERDQDKKENNGTATKLHHVVEAFRERWLVNKCLPNSNELAAPVMTVWMSLVNFCKKHQKVIKPVKVRTVQVQSENPDVSIEKILDSQEQNDELTELHERLTPDLVNLVDFLKKFVRHIDQRLKQDPSQTEQCEYIYHKLMDFISTYEVGDELERKTVQEVLGYILKENLLTGRFDDFIPPIIRILHKLIYKSSTNLMINYISELIQNIRSHLEDLATPTQQPLPMGLHSAIKHKTPKNNADNRRVTISDKLPTRVSMSAKEDERELEFKIATVRVEIEEYKDKLEEHVKAKKFDLAKDINTKIENLQADLNLLHGRRYSIASDVSQMDITIDEDPEKVKLSSTMLTQADTSLDESRSSNSGVKDEMRIFKHHANELIKCLQMYFACLKCVNISEVPPIMCSHLGCLTFEALDEWFKNNSRVRSLMIACNGLTALIDKSFAQQERTMMLLVSACLDNANTLQSKAMGFKCLVDVLIEHEEVPVPTERLERIINMAMRDYGKYDPKDIKKSEFEFVTAIVEGTAKLLYFQKIDSPEILSHMILWWYHPRTHSKLTQFIGIFLPMFVKDTALKRKGEDDKWLEELLAETYVTSIEYLHDYSLGAGQNIMTSNDMLNMMSYLGNLVPISFHPRVLESVDRRIDDLKSSCADLIKYLKQSKSHLKAAKALPLATSMAQPTIDEVDHEDSRDSIAVVPLKLFD